MAEAKKLAGAGLRGQSAGETALCTVGKTGAGLTYRGYDIKALADNAKFEEVAYTLHSNCDVWSPNLKKSLMFGLCHLFIVVSMSKLRNPIGEGYCDPFALTYQARAHPAEGGHCPEHADRRLQGARQEYTRLQAAD